MPPSELVYLVLCSLLPSACLAAAVWECPGDGLWADPYNCQHYYNCANGKAFHSVCPDGTHYDPKYKHCGWSKEIECEPATLASTEAPSTFGCPVGYSDISGGCYLFSHLHGLPKRSWAEARTFCQSMSTVDHRVDFAMLGNYSNPQDDPVLNYMDFQGMGFTWVGANYNPDENAWNWLDGSPLSPIYSMRLPTHPNSGDESICSAFGKNDLPYYVLFDIPCTWNRDFACMIHPGIFGNTP